MGEAAGSCLIFLRLKPNCKFQDSRQENQGAGILSSPFGFLFLIVQFQRRQRGTGTGGGEGEVRVEGSKMVLIGSGVYKITCSQRAFQKLFGKQTVKLITKQIKTKSLLVSPCRLASFLVILFRKIQDYVEAEIITLGRLIIFQQA